MKQCPTDLLHEVLKWSIHVSGKDWNLCCLERCANKTLWERLWRLWLCIISGISDQVGLSMSTTVSHRGPLLHVTKILKRLAPNSLCQALDNATHLSGELPSAQSMLIDVSSEIHSCTYLWNWHASDKARSSLVHLFLAGNRFKPEHISISSFLEKYSTANEVL